MAILSVPVRAAKVVPEAGDVVAFEKNSKWYTALVTKVEDKSYKVTWGDGSSGELAKGPFVIVVDLPAPQVPPMPFSTVKKHLLTKRKPKAEVPAPVVNPKDKLKEAPVHVPQHLADAYPHLGDHTLANRKKQLWFMDQLWRYYNQDKFHGKLKPCKLELMKAANPKSMKLRGYWSGGSRTLSLSPRLFNANLKTFVAILLHEMCHQAVSDVSWATMTSEEMKDNAKHKGHGEVWKNWMVSIGEPPSRYDANWNTEYMADVDFQKNLDKKEVQRGDWQAGCEKVTNMYLLGRIGQVFRWVTDGGATVREGVFLGRYGYEDHKFIFVGEEHLGNKKFLTVPDNKVFWHVQDTTQLEPYHQNTVHYETKALGVLTSRMEQLAIEKSMLEARLPQHGDPSAVIDAHKIYEKVKEIIHRSL